MVTSPERRPVAVPVAARPEAPVVRIIPDSNFIPSDPFELIVISPPIVVIAALIVTPAAGRVVVSPLFGDPAFRTTFSRLPAEVPEIAALISILPLAFKVRVESAPPALLMVPVTLILPACAPVALPVETVMLVPALKPADIEPADAVGPDRTFAPFPVATKLGDVPALLVGLVDIVKLYGSNNHSPPCPLKAEAVTNPKACKLLWLEVSTKPPFPPSIPPRAKISP